MPQRFYPAVLERDGDVFGLWFPDFPGCAAAARTQEEAMARASEALAEAMEAVAERDEPLPEPSPMGEIGLPEGCEFVAFVAVGATPPEPSERVNIYLPKSLIERVDHAAAERGMSRSSFFGLAVTTLLIRSREPGDVWSAARFGKFYKLR